MIKRKSKKQRIRDRIDELVMHYEFITWEMLDVVALTKKKRQFHLTYEGRLVFDYMAELRIYYVPYIEASGRQYSPLKKGFHNDIDKRRIDKIRQIKESKAKVS